MGSQSDAANQIIAVPQCGRDTTTGQFPLNNTCRTPRANIFSIVVSCVVALWGEPEEV
jgi:hypothetical protein